MSIESNLDSLVAVWEKLEDETRRRELSHWRDSGGSRTREGWLRIGWRTWSALEAHARFLGHSFDSLLSAGVLEWGPGGGANVAGAPSSVGDYFGVDISRSNLGEARRIAAEVGVPFHPIEFDGSLGPLQPLLPESVGIFLSTAVFQHFPSKEYTVDVLRSVQRVLAEQALVLIQIRHDDGDPRFAGIADPDLYATDDNFLRATSFSLKEFSRTLIDLGLQIDFITGGHTDTNYLTFHASRGFQSPFRMRESLENGSPITP